MKKIFTTIASSLGADYFLRKANKHPRVIFWHGIDNTINPLVEREMISTEVFEKQIYYLKKNYHIISLDDFYKNIVANEWEGNEICLMFDDGFKNNLTVAAPILKSNSLPFSVFVSTNHITTGRLFPTSLVRFALFGCIIPSVDIPCIEYKVDKISTDRQRNTIASELSHKIKTLPVDVVNSICSDLESNIPFDLFEEKLNIHSTLFPMNWNELKEIRNYGCTIGSHCLDHICCHKNQSSDEVEKQITTSKKVLEEKLNVSCDYFVYPNGSYTEVSNKFVEKAGYKLGFSTKTYPIEKNHCLASIPRICMPGDYELFKIKLNYYPNEN